MKKRLAAAVVGVMSLAMLMTGCEASKGLETDELTITQYKGVEVEQVDKPEEVTDEEVESTIQSILESHAETAEITDRAVENGDTVNIDFAGKIGGEEFDGGSSTDYPLTIGSGTFIEGFEDSVIGHNIGDTYDWEGKFPDDYAAADYAGKDVTFTITVKSITEQKLPELNDEFVKSVSEESKTVKEYKKEIKKQLEEDAETTYNDSLSAEVWEKVLDNTTVNKYPEDEIKELSDSLISQYKSAAEYSGMEYEEFIEQNMGYSVEEFEKQVEEAAKANNKQIMVTKAIADKEKITLDDKTYESELKELADMYGYEDVDALKEAAEEEDLKNIILNNLVKEWLVEHCVQVASE